MSVVYRCAIKHPRLTGIPRCPTCDELMLLSNHRPMLKVILNPVFRLFGWEIASLFEQEQGEWVFVKYQWKRTGDIK